MAELLLGMVRAFYYAGAHALPVAQAPDPAMAANSSSVMPSPPSPPPLGTDQPAASSSRAL